VTTHPTIEMLTLIAQRFKALADPGRLLLLDALRNGERTVTYLVYETGCSQTNVSKHLNQLYNVGLVRRRKAGPFVYYAISDSRVYQLCDVMCEQVRFESRSREYALQGSGT
jgi:DNA-binding transcriptional ArsR family regulator